MSESICRCDKILITKDFLSENMMGWSHDEKVRDVLNNDAYRQEIGVILDDRGYLRLCSTDDMQCLDHGDKIKINYCPMCGRKF